MVGVEESSEEKRKRESSRDEVGEMGKELRRR